MVRLLWETIWGSNCANVLYNSNQHFSVKFMLSMTAFSNRDNHWIIGFCDAPSYNFFAQHLGLSLNHILSWQTTGHPIRFSLTLHNTPLAPNFHFISWSIFPSGSRAGSWIPESRWMQPDKPAHWNHISHCNKNQELHLLSTYFGLLKALWLFVWN